LGLGAPTTHYSGLVFHLSCHPRPTWSAWGCLRSLTHDATHRAALCAQSDRASRDGSKDGSIGLTSPTPNLEFMERLSEHNSFVAEEEEHVVAEAAREMRASQNSAPEKTSSKGRLFF
jgi:hypothetical protein